MTARPFRDRVFRFVVWHELEAYLRAGWMPVRVRALGDYHDQFSALCEWLCDCPLANGAVFTQPSPDTPVVAAPAAVAPPAATAAPRGEHA